MRGVVLEGRGAVADPRLDGLQRVSVSVDMRADGSADVWGTLTMISESGAWSGDWTGSIDIGYTTRRLAGVLAGSGAYAGLELRYDQIGAERELVIVGTIGAAR